MCVVTNTLKKRTLQVATLKSSEFESFGIQKYEKNVNDANPIHKSIRTLIYVLADNISRTHSQELWDECVDELINALSSKLDNNQVIPERCKFFGELAYKLKKRQSQDRFIITICEHN